MYAWTPSDVVEVIGAVGSVTISVIAALRGTAAKATSEANAGRLDALSSHVRVHDTQLTNLALNIPPPTSPVTQALAAPGSSPLLTAAQRQDAQRFEATDPPPPSPLNTPSPAPAFDPNKTILPSFDSLIAPQGEDSEAPQ
ncbi:MAG: hypothetical protein JO250_12360 [Armatimonadetes bacterium]|nr:hypothetical protein [Armatimonadota bacterium]